VREFLPQIGDSTGNLAVSGTSGLDTHDSNVVAEKHHFLMLYLQFFPAKEMWDCVREKV
jgi:hypothetical protein